MARTGDGGESDEEREPGGGTARLMWGGATSISIANCVPPPLPAAFSSRVGGKCVTASLASAPGRKRAICATMLLMVSSVSGMPSSSTISRATSSGVSAAKSIGKVTVLDSPSMITWQDSSTDIG